VIGDGVIGRGVLTTGRTLQRAWSRFWFTPASASTLVLWRTAVGITGIAWLISIGADLDAFYGESGLRPNPFYPDHRYGLFQWVSADWILYTVYFAALLSAAVIVAGRWVRPAAIVLFYAILSIQLDNTSVLNSGDTLVRIWFAYFAIFALFTPSRCLQVPIFGLPGKMGKDRYPEVPSWLIRLVQVQLTVIYPAGLFEKLQGSNWQDGTAALYALGLEDFERFPVPSFITGSLFIGWILTYTTLAIEISVPFLLWTRRTRRFAVAAGVGLHLGMDYALRVGFFAWAMLIGYIAFLSTAESTAVLDWFGRRFSRRPQLDIANVPASPTL
jgi:HTTM domain